MKIKSSPKAKMPTTPVFSESSKIKGQEAPLKLNMGMGFSNIRILSPKNK